MQSWGKHCANCDACRWYWGYMRWDLEKAIYEDTCAEDVCDHWCDVKILSLSTFAELLDGKLEYGSARGAGRDGLRGIR